MSYKQLHVLSHVCCVLTFSKGFLNLVGISRQIQVRMPRFQVPDGTAASCHAEALDE